MDSKTADDNGQTTANETPHVNGINGHTNGHSRQNSLGSDKDMEVSISSDRSSVGGHDKLNLGSSKDVETPGKNNIGAYEKLKGIFRSRSSANSKTNSTPQIKVSMHPEGQDAKMSQKALRATKLTLDSQEGDGESDTDFEVPSDGNLYSYSVDNMMQFFKYLHFDDKIIKSLQRRKVDGRRFSKMTNEDLKKYGIDNPIVVYFRSKSEKKREASNLFML